MTTSPSSEQAIAATGPDVERRALVAAIAAALLPVALMLSSPMMPDALRPAIIIIPLGFLITSCSWSLVVAVRGDWPAALAMTGLVIVVVTILGFVVRAADIDQDPLLASLGVLAMIPIAMAFVRIPARSGLRRALLPLTINLVTIGMLLLVLLYAVALDE